MGKQTTNKEIFSVLGTIKIVDDKKRFVPASSAYTNTMIQKIPENTKVSCTFSRKIPTRSEAQLAYHFVLMDLLADYCGTTVMEMHDGVMRLKFGTKQIKIGNSVVEVRKSISNEAKMSKIDAVELVEYDLVLCADMNIRVPSKAELGYIDDGSFAYKPLTPVRK